MSANPDPGVRPAAAAPAPTRTTIVMGDFEIRDARDRPVHVYFARPAAPMPNARIVFVLHGSSRTGQLARDLGIPHVETRGIIAVAPHFAEEHHSLDDYRTGGTANEAGGLRPRGEWTLTIIDQIFERLRAEWKLSSETYDIIGHSAGGQFLHRLVLFLPEARYRRAVASAPAVFVLPLTSAPFPHGLAGTGIGDAELRAAFERDVVIAIGDRDIERRPWTVDEAAQGPHRYARALRFFTTVLDEAERIGAGLAWRLRIEHGVSHDPPKMIAALFEEVFRVEPNK